MSKTMASSSRMFWCGGGSFAKAQDEELFEIAVYSYIHVFKQVRRKAYLFVQKAEAAVMFASNPDGKEWRRSEWQVDDDDTLYAERTGHPYWVKFCWGGKAAEAAHYPVRTLMVEALDEKGQYVAYEGGDKERPWAFMKKVEEDTEEWATALGIMAEAKMVDAQYISLCRAKHEYSITSL